MKRGCRIIAVAGGENRAIKVLRSWDPELKVVAPGDWPVLVKENRALAVVFGFTAEGVERIKDIVLPVPAFYPLIGMSDDEIRERLKHITD